MIYHADVLELLKSHLFAIQTNVNRKVFNRKAEKYFFKYLLF